MPTYVYTVINPDDPDDSDGETFEIVQRMTEPALTKHPETGKPVRRVILAPNVGGDWSDGSTKSKLAPKNLERLGFTRYDRAGGGVYEKKAGKGPPTISAD